MDEPKPGTSGESGGKHDPATEDTAQDIEVIPVTKGIKLEKHNYDAQKENEEWERGMRFLGIPPNCSASHAIFNVMYRKVICPKSRCCMRRYLGWLVCLK